MIAYLAFESFAAADPTFTLRFATAVPDGSSWARELKGLQRDVERTTSGAVHIKWYWGSVVGDELTALKYIRSGRLDGAGGAEFCHRLAPSLRVFTLAGLVQSHAEADEVLRRLHKTLDEEFATSGFVPLSISSTLGSPILFTNTPVRSMAELRKQRLWNWDQMEVTTVHLTAMGLRVVPTPIEEAGRAADEGRVDGFYAIPTAALAFQWATRVRFFTNMSSGFLPGCIVVAQRAIDRLPNEYKEALRTAGAKFGLRFDEVGQQMDQALLGGLFEKQGIKPVSVSESFRAEFFEAARTAREKIDEKLVPRALIDRVQSILADYRAEHRP
jgi:TRAP-type C4-dicarboxylate transport system substrate-binding protein